MKNRRPLSVAIAAALALALSACGGQGDEGAAPAVTPSPQGDLPIGDETSETEPDAEDAENPWGWAFNEYLALTTTDFARAILADGVITTAERDEALLRANECLSLGGLEGQTVEGDWGLQSVTNRFDETGGIGFNFPDDREGIDFTIGENGLPQVLPWVQELLDECSAAYLGPVTLYSLIANDPQGTGWDQMQVDCLRGHGLVDEHFTTGDLFAIINPVIGGVSTCEEAEESPRWLNCVANDDGSIRSIETNPDWTQPPMTLPGGASLDHGQGRDFLRDPSS